MATRIIGGLTHGTAPSGRIRHGNPEFANVDGPTPKFAFGPGQVLHSGDLDSVAYGKHALRTAPCGRIPEFTRIGGDVDKARSSERYDSVDWWRLDVHNLGFKPRLIQTPRNHYTTAPLVINHANAIDLTEKAFLQANQEHKRGL